MTDNASRGGAQRQSDTELAGLLCHHRREQTVQADDRDERGERRKEREEQEVRAPGRLLARDFVTHERDADRPVRVHRAQARVNRRDGGLRRSARADDDVADRELRLIVRDVDIERRRAEVAVPHVGDNADDGPPRRHNAFFVEAMTAQFLADR